MTGTHATGSSTGTCPGNKIAVGVGFQMRVSGQDWSSASFGLQVRAAWVNGNQGIATGRNANIGQVGEIQAVVVCIDPIPGLRQTDGSAAPSGGAILVAERFCNLDEVLVGGGFSVTPNLHLHSFGFWKTRTPSGQVPVTVSARGYVQTLFWTDAQELEVRALCAPQANLPYPTIEASPAAMQIGGQGSADVDLACRVAGEQPLAFGMRNDTGPAAFGNHAIFQSVMPSGAGSVNASVRNRSVIGGETISVKATAICAKVQ